MGGDVSGGEGIEGFAGGVVCDPPMLTYQGSPVSACFLPSSRAKRSLVDISCSGGAFVGVSFGDSDCGVRIFRGPGLPKLIEYPA